MRKNPRRKGRTEENRWRIVVVEQNQTGSHSSAPNRGKPKAESRLYQTVDLPPSGSWLMCSSIGEQDKLRRGRVSREARSIETERCGPGGGTLVLTPDGLRRFMASTHRRRCRTGKPTDRCGCTHRFDLWTASSSSRVGGGAAIESQPFEREARRQSEVRKPQLRVEEARRFTEGRARVLRRAKQAAGPWRLTSLTMGLRTVR